MPDDKQRISHATNVEGLAHGENALDRARAIKDQFNSRAQDQKEPHKSKEGEQSQGGAQQGGSVPLTNELDAVEQKRQQAEKARAHSKARQDNANDRER